MELAIQREWMKMARDNLQANRSKIIEEIMPDQKKIFAEKADQYELLVDREDYQHNILPALQNIVSFKELNVVELGAGTGRLTRLLTPLAKAIFGFDLSPAMLQVAAAKLSPHHHGQLAVADHRHIPLDSHVADIIISGWSYCYLVVSHKETWEQELTAGLAEIKRVLRPGGTFIILETLGTGYETPFVYESLVDYFAQLKNRGFQKTWIRTDFRFRSLAEASSSIGFFFGDEMAQKVIDNNWITLPECTGIWWQKI